MASSKAVVPAVAREHLTPERQFWGLQVALPGLGLGLLLAGFHLGVALAVDAGVLALAMAALASGAACIWRRRIVFLYPSTYRYQLVVWQGPAARFIGAGLVVLGLGVAAVGMAHAGGMSATAIRDGLLQRPGLALAPAGLVLLANAIAMLIGFREGRDPSHGALWNLLMSIPGRLGGLIGLVIGGAVLTLGVYELVSPEGFDLAIDSLKHGWPP